MIQNFDLEFGKGLSIRQFTSYDLKKPVITGSLHHLSPIQFDNLVEQFDVIEESHTFSVERQGKQFRSATIDFGGLKLSIYAEVPATEFFEVGS